MIPGPYSICHVTLREESDASVYAQLKYGYDTAAQAHAALPSVAAEAGVSPDECAVIRHIDAEEVDAFRS